MSCVCIKHAKKSFSGIFNQHIKATTAVSRYPVTNPILLQQAQYYNYPPPAYADLYSLPQQDTSHPFQDQQQNEDYLPPYPTIPLKLYPITESHPATEPTVSHPATEPTVSHPATEPTVSHPVTEPTVSHPAIEPVTEPTVSHLATEPNPGEEAL